VKGDGGTPGGGRAFGTACSGSTWLAHHGGGGLRPVIEAALVARRARPCAAVCLGQDVRPADDAVEGGGCEAPEKLPAKRQLG